MSKEIELINKQILNYFPFGYALINKNFNFISYNSIFSEIFPFVNSSDHTILSLFDDEIKRRFDEVFESGVEITLNRTSENPKINFQYLLIKFIPIIENKVVENILCIVIDNSEAENWHKEYNKIFEKVPSYISIVDKDFKVIRSNEKYKDTFGDLHSVFTTESAVKKAFDNSNSPTALTFKEGREQMATQIGTTQSGNKIHLMVSSTPHTINEDGVSLVLEISSDITELNQLQEQLHIAHDFYADLIESSADGIIAIDNKGKMQIFNKSARRILNWNYQRKPGIAKINEVLPEEFFQEPDLGGNLINDKEFNIKSYSEDTFPVRINAFELRNKKNVMGRVAFIQDLRRIKELENEKSKAIEEALTTTFLALESNIQKLQNDQQFLLDKFENLLKNRECRIIENDWSDMRQKMNYIFDVVSTFMKIAKGFEPKYENIDIKNVANNVYNNVLKLSNYASINYNQYFLGDIESVTADLESLEIILKILLSNGMESASVNLNNPKVMLIVEYNEKLNNLIISVTDNGNLIDNEILESFLRIKDSVDARIGLLTIDMITKKLGGSLYATSNSHEGNKFKIVLPVKKV